VQHPGECDPVKEAPHGQTEEGQSSTTTQEVPVQEEEKEELVAESCDLYDICKRLGEDLNSPRIPKNYISGITDTTVLDNSFGSAIANHERDRVLGFDLNYASRQVSKVYSLSRKKAEEFDHRFRRWSWNWIGNLDGFRRCNRFQFLGRFRLWNWRWLRKYRRRCNYG
jgi:hypothetical protein